MPKPLTLIAACSENRVIGRDGRLPWSIPEDMDHFKVQTVGRILILGRASFSAWPGAVRHGRRPIVVTRDSSLARPPVRTAPDLAAALALAETLPGEIYVCGGQRIFEEAIVLPQAARLLLTLVHAEVPGDRFFPEWRTSAWRETARREGADAHWRYAFLVFERCS